MTVEALFEPLQGLDPLESAVDADCPEPLTATIPAEYEGERLDKVLAYLFPQYSRACLQSWVKAERVQVAGALASLRQKACEGAMVALWPDLKPEQQAFRPEPVPLSIVYEDASLVVINKPAGCVVHPAVGNWGGTLLNGLLHRYGAAAAALPRAGIVHRLDKDTSGLMVVARTLEAQTALVRQLQARTVKRMYQALVWGTPPVRGLVNASIGRDPRSRIRMAVVVGAASKPARTHYLRCSVSMAAGLPVAALLCALETGRTHQIRVHLSHLGYPIVGDPLYGRGHGQQRAIGFCADQASSRAKPSAAVQLASELVTFPRQFLHACQLAFAHPESGEPLSWQAELPDDAAALAQKVGVHWDAPSTSV